MRRGITLMEPWFDRKFDFPLPVDALPAIVGRLREAPNRLKAVLRDRDAAVLTTKPGGKWSAQEHAGHLNDLEPLWVARLNDFVAGATLLTPADLTNRKTEEARHNDRSVVDIVVAFHAGRHYLLHRLGSIDVAAHTPAIVHPRLQTPMRIVDHLFFVAEHDDYHLACIEQLLR